MQLVFTVEELKVLADTLLECEARARHQANNPVTPLLQKVLARDLRLGVDELEDMEQMLKDAAARLKCELDETPAGARKDELLRRQEMLERVIDRVTEACVMA